MVLDWGMSEKVGPVNYSNDDKRIMPMDLSGKDYSDRTAEVIDGEVKSLIDAAYARTRRLLEENRSALEAIARALQKYETLTADDVRQIIEGKTLDKPTVDDLLAAEHAKTSKAVKGVTHSPPLPDPPAGTVPEPG